MRRRGAGKKKGEISPHFLRLGRKGKTQLSGLRREKEGGGGRGLGEHTTGEEEGPQ